MGFTAVATASYSVGIAWNINSTAMLTLLQINSCFSLSGTLKKQSLAAGGASSNRAATLPMASYAPAIFRKLVCATYKMAARTLRELDELESPRMFRSVLQSPYNLKWLDYRALGMRTRLETFS